MNRKTTLSAVAAAAGVSVATVDRVINNRGGVSPRREAQVLEAARALNLDRVAFRTPRRTVRIAFVIAPRIPTTSACPTRSWLRRRRQRI